MAAIERTPLQASNGSPWDAVAAQVRAWASARELALHDLVVLLPFSALLPIARQAFARHGGWQPRIETLRTLAASLGPPVPAQAMQLSFDVAADRLVAARLLRMQSAGASWAKSDPRRFDRAVAAVVETAQALAGAAHVCLEVDDIAQTWSQLLAAGATGQGRIAAVKSGPVDSCLAGYIRDPNGILIELLELKKD